MMEFLSNWTKSIGVSIVLVSIIEMILPNNKTKKYIRMLLGIFVIFNIMSPLVKNKDKLNFDDLNIDDYTQEASVRVNQDSMDERINELYEEELEKDITKKLEEMGYKINNVKVETKRTEESWEIKKIKLDVEVINKKQVEDFLIKEYGVSRECLKIN